MTEPAVPPPSPGPETGPLPLLPLRDVVVFPRMIMPLFVGRPKSVRALEHALAHPGGIVLVAQRRAEIEEPAFGDLYTVGTRATILQLLKLPDGTVKVLVEGQDRVRVTLEAEEPFFLIRAVPLAERGPASGEGVGVLRRAILDVFEQYAKLSRRIPPETVSGLGSVEDLHRLIDAVMAQIAVRIEDKQAVLEMESAAERAERTLALMQAEIEVLKIERTIQGRVKEQMEHSQREYYLNEQMKAIQRELGQMGEDGGDLEELEERIRKSGMPKEVRAKAEAELRKLRQMTPMSAEATVVRNYIDTLLAVPWKKRTRARTDLKEAARILEEDHYGLDKAKERILEYLAVLQRTQSLKGPILCLVGPPGVGKTSLAQSIARATGRRFLKMSLGGVRDEAEIRGHRRTYIGSMPGKIVQSLSKGGVRNPLFLLDEIDKMAMDFRGDPSAALLEVLDPEQNHAFNDHYLEVDVDLSDVLFVATANTLHSIPPPLLDRLEVLRLAGYTEEEKVHIARRHLIPKQRARHGLKDEEFTLEDAALTDIVRYYTSEAGVRNLEREIATLCRKVTRALQEGRVAEGRVVVGPDDLETYLGVRRYRHGAAESEDRIGLVNGLAWTEVGGELLSVEAAVVPGKGKLLHTGHLGEVMQESIQAAVTVVRSRAVALGIDPEFSQKTDVHIHVPEGATPKDGPSAGVAMATALVSALTAVPVRAQVAMTGEITLRGEVLPIGGLKEKLLAAQRGGIRTVLIPKENVKDLKEIPENVTRDLEIRPVQWIDEVLAVALHERFASRPASSVDPLAGDEGGGRARPVETGPLAH
jgi:ATP-dependent Lon protease